MIGGSVGSDSGGARRAAGARTVGAAHRAGQRGFGRPAGTSGHAERREQGTVGRSAGNDPAAVAVQRQIDALAPATGMQAVTGPGVVLVADDAESPVASGSKVVDVDLRQAVNGIVAGRCRGDRGQRAPAVVAHRHSRRGRRHHRRLPVAHPALPHRSHRRPDGLLRAFPPRVGAWWAYLGRTGGIRYDLSTAGNLRLEADPGPGSGSPGTTKPRGEVPCLAIVGLILGIALGIYLEPTLPVGLQPYLPIAIVAALDALFGGFRAYLERVFDDKVFVVSFTSNVLIAALIVWVGDQIEWGRSCRRPWWWCSAFASLHQRGGDQAGVVPYLSTRPKHGATESRRLSLSKLESVEPDEAEGLDKLDQPVESKRDKRDKLDQPDGSDPRPPVDWRELVRDFVQARPRPGGVRRDPADLGARRGHAGAQPGPADRLLHHAARRSRAVAGRPELREPSAGGRIPTRRDQAPTAERRRQRTGRAREGHSAASTCWRILGAPLPAQGSWHQGGDRRSESSRSPPELLLNTIEELRDAGAGDRDQSDRSRRGVHLVRQRARGHRGHDQTITAPISIDVIGEPHALTGRCGSRAAWSAGAELAGRWHSRHRQRPEGDDRGGRQPADRKVRQTRLIDGRVRVTRYG